LVQVLVQVLVLVLVLVEKEANSNYFHNIHNQKNNIFHSEMFHNIFVRANNNYFHNILDNSTDCNTELHIKENDF
jgi:hypothetical protein